MLAVAALFLAPTAHGATWRQVTSTGGASVEQVALLRAPNDVLHVAWRHRSGPNTDDLHHTTFVNGRVGATTPIATGWAGIQNPALVLMPEGLRVFFGGMRTTDTSDPNRELNTALSANGGTSWAVQTGSIVPGGAQAYGSPVSAATLPGGTPLQAWAGTLGTWVHAGLSPATPNHEYQALFGNYGYDPGIAANTAGQAFMAWYSNAMGNLGVHAQGVAADGSALGSALTMPGTGAMAVGMIGRTPIVARVGGGFYVAYATGYPVLNSIRLWRVGAPTTLLLARTGGNATATLAADGNGRLWVAWTNIVGASPRVLAARSNRAATKFGAVVDAGRPPGASSIYRLDASATPGALDVFANASIGINPGSETYATRVLPGLTLTADPTRLRRGRTRKVSFRVTDAGDPVAGARVRVRGRSGMTNARGRVMLDLVGRGRSLSARATKGGYTEAALTLRVIT
jgi:hypothetical protein